MLKLKNKLLILSLGIFCLPFLAIAMTTDDAEISKFDAPRGTLKKPIIDSQMTEKQAFEGLDSKCPPEIRNRQRVVTVNYFSTDRKIHQGQIIVDKDLVDDVKTFFKEALNEKFPIHSVIPVSAPQFRKNNRWDDDLSMAADNSSGFNYREKTGGGSLSNHAFGRAIDINTFENPYIKGTLILPPGANYNPNGSGVFAPENPLVKSMRNLGWDWGGNWTNLKDYQHFEKPLKKEQARQQQ